MLLKLVLEVFRAAIPAVLVATVLLKLVLEVFRAAIPAVFDAIVSLKAPVKTEEEATAELRADGITSAIVTYPGVFEVAAGRPLMLPVKDTFPAILTPPLLLPIFTAPLPDNVPIFTAPSPASVFIFTPPTAAIVIPPGIVFDSV